MLCYKFINVVFLLQPAIHSDPSTALGQIISHLQHLIWTEGFTDAANFFLKEGKGFNKICPGCEQLLSEKEKRKIGKRRNNFKLNNGWIQI